jgi:hypothetical protein
MHFVRRHDDGGGWFPLLGGKGGRLVDSAAVNTDGGNFHSDVSIGEVADRGRLRHVKVLNGTGGVV